MKSDLASAVTTLSLEQSAKTHLKLRGYAENQRMPHCEIKLRKNDKKKTTDGKKTLKEKQHRSYRWKCIASLFGKQRNRHSLFDMSHHHKSKVIHKTDLQVAVHHKTQHAVLDNKAH